MIKCDQSKIPTHIFSLILSLTLIVSSILVIGIKYNMMYIENMAVVKNKFLIFFISGTLTAEKNFSGFRNFGQNIIRENGGCIPVYQCRQEVLIIINDLYTDD